MNSFVKGLLVGVGIGLIVAPMRGEEMRRLLRERFDEVRGEKAILRADPRCQRQLRYSVRDDV